MQLFCKDSRAVKHDQAVSNYPDSAANSISAAAFAWGLRHDRASDKHGVTKDDSETLVGYRRFLDLKTQQKRGRFGFKKTESMIAHAESRVNFLSDDKE